MVIKINQTQFIILTKQGGKMIGLFSINTNKYTNKNCIALSSHKNNNLVCKNCYVNNITKRYKDMTPAYQHNSEILTTRILTSEEIKNLSREIMNYSIFRFESFGDLNNEIQLINYINIAKACKWTKFGLWTKHFKIVLDYFKKGFKMPKNITLVLSAPFKDQALKEGFVNLFKKYHSRVITFTVLKDKNDPRINCGKRKCIECRNCYDSKKPVDVYELIK